MFGDVMHSSAAGRRWGFSVTSVRRYVGTVFAGNVNWIKYCYILLISCYSVGVNWLRWPDQVPDDK